MPHRVHAAIAPPSFVIADENTRALLLCDKLYPADVSEVTQIEIVPDEVNELDARNGRVQQEWKLPSPYVEGTMVKVVLKNYGPRNVKH